MQTSKGKFKMQIHLFPNLYIFLELLPITESHWQINLGTCVFNQAMCVWELYWKDGDIYEMLKDLSQKRRYPSFKCSEKLCNSNIEREHKYLLKQKSNVCAVLLKYSKRATMCQHSWMNHPSKLTDISNISVLVWCQWQIMPLAYSN